MVRIKLGPVSTAATCDIQSGKIAVNDMVKFLSADGTVILDNIPLPFIPDKDDIFAVFDTYTINDSSNYRSKINFNYFYNPL